MENVEIVEEVQEVGEIGVELSSMEMPYDDVFDVVIA